MSQQHVLLWAPSVADIFSCASQPGSRQRVSRWHSKTSRHLVASLLFDSSCESNFLNPCSSLAWKFYRSAERAWLVARAFQARSGRGSRDVGSEDAAQWGPLLQKPPLLWALRSGCVARVSSFCWGLPASVGRASCAGRALPAPARTCRLRRVLGRSCRSLSPGGSRVAMGLLLQPSARAGCGESSRSSELCSPAPCPSQARGVRGHQLRSRGSGLGRKG